VLDVVLDLVGHGRDQERLPTFLALWRNKKDDNAHIEQKNWTHVRKLLGYVRYDTPAAQAAIHRLYRGALRLFQTLFLPSVTLLRKERVGARVRRRYDAPCTPLDRVLACPELRPEVAAQLQRLRGRLDPFALAHTIEQHLERIYALANPRHQPAPAAAPPTTIPRRVRNRPSFTLTRRPGRPPRSVTSEMAR